MIKTKKYRDLPGWFPETFVGFLPLAENLFTIQCI